MIEHIATTYLEFADRFEGLVLHVGDEESCVRTAELLSGLSYSGKETVLRGGVKVLQRDKFHNLEAGQKWNMPKPATGGQGAK